MSYCKAEAMTRGIYCVLHVKSGKYIVGLAGRRGTIVTPRTNCLVIARPLQMAVRPGLAALCIYTN